MIEVTARDIERAKAGRAEVLAAMGTDRGYSGHFLRTETPCPACKRAGHKTNGGYTPTLRVRVPDGVVSQAIVCHTHGENPS